MKIKIILTVETSDYDERILENEFKVFIADLDWHSELIDFSVKQLQEKEHD